MKQVENVENAVPRIMKVSGMFELSPHTVHLDYDGVPFDEVITPPPTPPTKQKHEFLDTWEKAEPPKPQPIPIRKKRWYDFLFFWRSKMKKPETEQYWTILYYGHRGSCKSFHQAKLILQVLEYLELLYRGKPHLNKAIVYSVQRFKPEIEKKYSEYLYYWNDASELRYCPRPDCWKGKEPHRLHGAYVVFDDIATILPADQWANTPIWMRKLFSQARHFGIRVIANLQDPFSVDVNFRRYTDVAYKFRKMIGSADPDETKTPVKKIWGIYYRRKVKADILWKLGDMTDEEIAAFKETQRQRSEVQGFTLYKDLFKATFHLITKQITEIYDTTQDVPEYKPTGYEHVEFFCQSPLHNHEDKTAPNYCGYKKVQHNLV